MINFVKSIKDYRFKKSDYVVILGIILSLIFVSMNTVDIAYDWNWSMTFGYVYHIDENTGDFYPGVLIIGFINTIRLFVMSIIIGSVVGIILCFMRLSKNKGINIIASSYVNFVRNIPPLVFLFIFYFFISEQVFPKMGLTVDLINATPLLSFIFGDSVMGINLISAGICLGLFESVFFAEIMRGAIKSIQRGQYDASAALGMTWAQRMRYIIVPQALRKSYPSLAGQCIVALKNTSIASLVSVKDLVFSGVEVVSSTRAIFEPWIVVAIVYFIMCFSLAKLFAKWEKIHN